MKFALGSPRARFEPWLYFPVSGGGTPTPGPELIVDPGFDTPADWTLGPSVTVSGSAAHWTAAAIGRSVQPNPVLTITAGATYRVAFTIAAISGGSLTAGVGGAFMSTTKNAPGPYTEDLVATTTGNALIRSSASGTTADADNFSVKLIS